MKCRQIHRATNKSHISNNSHTPVASTWRTKKATFIWISTSSQNALICPTDFIFISLMVCAIFHPVCSGHYVSIPHLAHIFARLNSVLPLWCVHFANNLLPKYFGFCSLYLMWLFGYLGLCWPATFDYTIPLDDSDDSVTQIDPFSQTGTYLAVFYQTACSAVSIYWLIS